MAYFNHAFHKVFVGTQTSGVGAGQNPNANLNDGFIIAAGIGSEQLSVTSTTSSLNYGVGSYGFFDSSYQSVIASGITGCCSLTLASAALYQKDKVGPFMGGYQESNKSKLINPKFVRQFYRVDPCTPQNNVVNIGNTPYTASGITLLAAFVIGTETYVNGTYLNVNLTGGTGTGAKATVVVAGNVITSVTLTSPGINYTAADVLTVSSAAVATPGSVTELVAGTATTDVVTSVSTVSDATCCKEFLCDETYTLRLDVKGSPTLRFLNHNAYQMIDFYTGCCPADCGTPVAVDSTLVMIGWADKIINNPYMQAFVQPVVVDETGGIWYAPGTVGATQTWDTYVSAGHIANACSGLILYGAYVSTEFGDCSFQPSDFFEKEPVKILASLVDFNGDPCIFESICVYQECYPRQGSGFGETVLRSLILSESYLQNYFSTDIRIREITQGVDILDAINRRATYTLYYILHSVPRYNNPTGVFDNDQYLLEIVSTTINADLETFMAAWLNACTDCVSLETHSCTDCTPVVPQVP